MQRFSLPPPAAGRAGWEAFMEMGWLKNLLVRSPVAHFDRRLARFWCATGDMGNIMDRQHG
jgi:hypothetical protein